MQDFFYDSSTVTVYFGMYTIPEGKKRSTLLALIDVFVAISEKKTKQKQQNACLSKGIVSFGLEHSPIYTFVLCTRALLQCLWHQSANKWDFLPRKVAQHSSFWREVEGWNQCRWGIFTVGGECLAENGRFLQRWVFSTRCFKVTFWFPTWRSLSPLKGHLTIPKRSQRIAR